MDNKKRLYTFSSGTGTEAVILVSENIQEDDLSLAAGAAKEHWMIDESSGRSLKEFIFEELDEREIPFEAVNFTEVEEAYPEDMFDKGGLYEETYCY